MRGPWAKHLALQSPFPIPRIQVAVPPAHLGATPPAEQVLAPRGSLPVSGLIHALGSCFPNCGLRPHRITGRKGACQPSSSCLRGRSQQSAMASHELVRGPVVTGRAAFVGPKVAPSTAAPAFPAHSQVQFTPCTALLCSPVFHRPEGLNFNEVQLTKFFFHRSHFWCCISKLIVSPRELGQFRCQRRVCSCIFKWRTVAIPTL